MRIPPQRSGINRPLRTPIEVEVPDLDQLVERYYAPLYRFALSLAGAESGAADLTQETFYLWASKGHQLRDSSKVKAWLFTTLYREFLRLHRHGQRFPHQPLGDVEEDLPRVDPGVGESLDGLEVLGALAHVDEVYRVPLTLFFVEDFSYREIAEALEVPVGTIMSRLARGKMQLRELLGAAGQRQESKVIPFQNRARA